MRWAAALCALAALAGTAAALCSYGCRPGDIPKPDRDRYTCGTEGLRASVCDPDELLSLSWLDTIDEMLTNIRIGHGDYIIDPCSGSFGFQVAVVLLRKIDYNYKSGSSAAAKGVQFATDVANNWGLGDARCNNGILVLVETEGWGYGRAFAIVAGKGAAPYLQKEKISGIESDFVADMRAGESLEGALYNAIHNIGWCLGHSCYGKPAYQPGTLCSVGCQPKDIPRPDKNPQGCGTGSLRTNICDPDGYLTAAEIKSIDSMLVDIRNARGTNIADPCTGWNRYGFQVGVLIVDKMSPSYMKNYATWERGARFASDVVSSWGLGDSGCNNGILLFIEKEGRGSDRTLAIATGKGAERYLQRAKIQGIQDDFKADVRDVGLARAIEYAVNSIGYCLGHECYSTPAYRA